MTTNNQPEIPGLEKPLKRNEQHPEGGKLPQWITTQLRAGKINGANQTAKYHRCRKCKEIVLTGLNAHAAAWTITVDPTPLTKLTELAAILTNRDTVQATRHPGQGYELNYRTPGDQWPTNPLVLPQHKCGHRFPGFLEPPTTTNPTANAYGVPDEPTF